VFNVQQPEIGLPFLRAAKAAGKATALSTIFWDLSHAHFAMVLNRLGRDAVDSSRGTKRAAESVFRMLGRPSYFSAASRQQVAEMVGLADILLPNSSEEAGMVGAYIGQTGLRFEVVVNAVDGTVFSRGEPQEGAGLIQAGNFEAVKNHMGVLRALETRPEIPITFVGSPTNPAYVERLRARAGKNVTMIDRSLPPQELAELYRRHMVHVNPSFRESPGLATMEALACGCRAVVASEEFCPVATYFGELVGRAVFVCDPYDKRSILGAIEQALNAREEADLSGWLAKFTWAEAARQTYKAYKQVV
jgi:glycosyltransferase involved in cell wall biosynthesis